jgi:hypothetical protein
MISNDALDSLEDRLERERYCDVVLALPKRRRVELHGFEEEDGRIVACGVFCVVHEDGTVEETDQRIRIQVEEQVESPVFVEQAVMRLPLTAKQKLQRLWSKRSAALRQNSG